MDSNRRFSEREVALVLRKATELEQIASEVGISPALIQRAVAEIDRKARSNPLAGAPLSSESIRAVTGELGAEGVAALVAAVERNSDLVGEVTEAVGTTRWTARGRFGWTRFAGRRAARVDKLAGELAQEAASAARSDGGGEDPRR
ncbi:MAG TPA: hypothetical protein VLA36_03070 [Longimicrobiales bacterium]|nr:hypothetical protein [Longimicrobiales bacterium]